MKGCSLFVVRSEGGRFEKLPYHRWIIAVDAGVPIFGVRLGPVRLLFDRIAKRLGHAGLRMMAV